MQATANELHMDSALKFTNDEAGTQEMYSAQNRGHMRFYAEAHTVVCGEAHQQRGSSKKTLFEKLHVNAAKCFDEDEENKKKDKK